MGRKASDQWTQPKEKFFRLDSVENLNYKFKIEHKIKDDDEFH